MKYSEFKRIMEDAGFFVGEFNTYIHVYTLTDSPIASVDKICEGAIDLIWNDYFELPVEKRKFIAEKCMELTFTPIEDRED